MNIALYLVCNNAVVLMANVLIFSFLKNNKWFCGDIVILHDDDICKLTPTAKRLLSNSYKKIKFKKVDTTTYSDLFYSIRKNAKGSRLRTLPCIYKWEVFKPSEYDHIIYLDADTLVTGDLTELFRLSSDYGFVGAADSISWDLDRYNGFYPAGTGVQCSTRDINGGVYVVSKKYMSDSFFDELISFANSLDFKSFYKRLGRGRVGEQTILSRFFINHDYYLVSNRYNRIRRVVPDGLVKRKPDFLSSLKIIHYTSGKPTTTACDRIRLKGKHRSYKLVNNLWRDYHELSCAE